MSGKAAWQYREASSPAFWQASGTVNGIRSTGSLLADIVCPAILIGQAIGRMANLLNGDAFGTPTGSNFGLLYPEGTLAF